MQTTDTVRYSAGRWILMIYAVIMILLGLPLLVGGAWLVILGGSVYYIIAGIGLIVAGTLLFRAQMAGLWVYVATFLLTIIWGLAEVGLHGWALIPWTVGPIILLIITLLFIPVLRNGGTYRTAEEI
jgi:quinoprotein glucose dehydrogenase